MTKHSQNGPTFTKAPPTKRRRMTDDEIASWQARKDAEMEEEKRTAAVTKDFNQGLRKDRKGTLQKLFQRMAQLKKP